MTDIEPKVIETEIVPVLIETEISTNLIESEITPNQIELSIAPAQNITYKLESFNGYQALPTANINIQKYTILSNSSEGLIIADPFDLNTWNIAGIALENISNGGTLLIQYNGIITNNLWNWQMATPLFLGINGQLTQHPPDGALFLSQVATPVNTNSILIDIKEIILL